MNFDPGASAMPLFTIATALLNPSFSVAPTTPAAQLGGTPVQVPSPGKPEPNTSMKNVSPTFGVALLGVTVTVAANPVEENSSASAARPCLEISFFTLYSLSVIEIGLEQLLIMLRRRPT